MRPKDRVRKLLVVGDWGGLAVREIRRLGRGGAGGCGGRRRVNLEADGKS